ncbi:MAG: helix-turn-helix transcriptional regulator [Yersinia sp. (in: enterobacteria)]|jgi:DNA-binding CsgD family transcriptional regulator
MESKLIDSLEMLIRFWEKSSEPWAVKDSQSKYIYGNPRLYKLLNLPDQYSIEGRLDGELPAPVSDFQTVFQQQDRKVELLQDRITSVDIHLYDGLSYFTAYFCDKFPLMDENGVSQGVICHSRQVQDVMLSHLNKIKLPTSLMLTPPPELFINEEWEVLFYIFHSFSDSEISKKLHLSPGTVSNITQSIYGKVGVSSREQIVEYCFDNNINNYVPESFFEYSGSFPFEE